MMLQNNSGGLYHPSFEHDSCGIGFVANIKGIKSHQHISDALTILENMEHRGACGCEANTGDGAGIMLQVPHEFFFDECVRLGVHLPAFGKYGVGVLFFPKDIRLKEECREIFSRCAEHLGLEILVYRKVPVNPTNIGATALSVELDGPLTFPETEVPRCVSNKESYPLLHRI
jgi:glutamate synthase (NADPH/NADH) large chain